MNKIVIWFVKVLYEIALFMVCDSNKNSWLGTIIRAPTLTVWPFKSNKFHVCTRRCNQYMSATINWTSILLSAIVCLSVCPRSMLSRLVLMHVHLNCSPFVYTLEGYINNNIGCTLFRIGWLGYLKIHIHILTHDCLY